MLAVATGDPIFNTVEISIPWWPDLSQFQLLPSQMQSLLCRNTSNMWLMSGVVSPQEHAEQCSASELESMKFLLAATHDRLLKTNGAAEARGEKLEAVKRALECRIMQHEFDVLMAAKVRTWHMYHCHAPCTPPLNLQTNVCMHAIAVPFRVVCL